MTADEVDRHIRNVWLSIFRRAGGSGRYTRPFDEFPEGMRNDVLRHMKLEIGELPVLLARRTANDGCLITTRCVRSLVDGMEYVTRLSDVENVRPFRLGLMRKGEMNKLVIETSKREQVVLELEEGPPFFGTLNVLMNVVARNGSS